MGQLAEKRLSAKQAVEAAFEHFNELYGSQKLRNLLLEGIRYDELLNSWDVTIGFDIGREKIGQLNLLEKNWEPVREFRIVKLRADNGEFLELDHE
ncbi:hypothetical protein [Sulfitobacter mediterraneus]|uniref:Uncharacterized protein n=1 Tax=Sulfitobacter mediterraneus TaxID=83219 RepID=A0A2T6CAS4_9RHOB|nr:hypothetical protein [Sulfitobacter mediterraneus]KIN79135.1 hypothetical protein Z950_3140 [Sulfitobacter mediterraneus KCTC 32188]PTX72319.1 hypothetical protein C8N31_11130 [Sulfitobacter mediterraneus]